MYKEFTSDNNQYFLHFQFRFISQKLQIDSLFLVYCVCATSERISTHQLSCILAKLIRWPYQSLRNGIPCRPVK